MRAAILLMAGLLALSAASSVAQTRPTAPTAPLGPAPSGGVLAARPLYVTGEPVRRGILTTPVFAPPGTQVPGGPPASNTPTLLRPTILGIN